MTCIGRTTRQSAAIFPTTTGSSDSSISSKGGGSSGDLMRTSEGMVVSGPRGPLRRDLERGRPAAGDAGVRAGPGLQPAEADDGDVVVLRAAVGVPADLGDQALADPPGPRAVHQGGGGLLGGQVL